MLNIINILKKSQIIKTLKKKGNTVNIYRRNVPLSKEWNNSIYSFNKNPIRFLPAVHSFMFKLLKIHFNMHNKYLELRDWSNKQRKIKRSLLNNKVWVSTPEIKHLNKKAIVTFYVYNRLYGQYKRQLDLLEFTWNPIVCNTKSYSEKRNTTISKHKTRSILVTKKIKMLRRDNLLYLGTNKATKSKNQNFYLKIIKWLKSEKLSKIEQCKNQVKLFNNSDFIKLNRYNYLINQFKKELIYLKLKQKMLFNQFKFNEIYLDLLVNWLETVYKKKIKLNIVVLKHHYLSSSILAQMAIANLISRKQRGNARRPVNDIIQGSSIPNLSGKKVQREEKMSVGMQNVTYKNLKKNNKHDSLNKFLLINMISKIWSSKYIDNFAMQNIENKSVAGLFIKATGRLTKRYKAQRAMSVLRYRGTLKNVYSAHKGYSSVLSRGYNNINVDKTIIHSKVRIGAFGLTGWVASC